ncbi:leucyl aminopeptidase family protein [Acetobacteraceae bacterium KSS8]|uniref:Leucyl aminopeptidase family protein n=1 Tax=Endosaccharibacter trunci TaxID=2812733 RepID=A0ABT1W2M4_9PROT|nr:leucyl aminopeptidase family protein [Acetobacteraceae bacterium KSS8]
MTDTIPTDRPLDCLLEPTDQRAASARTVRAVRPDGLDSVLAALTPAQAAWVTASGFKASGGELLMLPGADGIDSALLGLGREGGPFAYGGLAAGLGRAGGGEAPVWRLALPEGEDADTAVLGFCLGAYRFTAFREPKTVPALLVAPDAGGKGREMARATWLARDLINMPANRLGPRELAEAARDVAVRFGARVSVVSGDSLSAAYPTVAAVGAGSSRAPCVLLAEWRGSGAGEGAPHLSLVGKGVVFDTGGYDLKTSAGMLRMKKDMGGAALMLALARAVMAMDLPLRLSLRLGCVENSVSGTAMRPSDILRTRRGLSVEIGNTDAEGRLVLCDLLAEASDEKPDLLLDAATLTGAARVALGPDLPALFANDDALAAAFEQAGIAASDPVWRLPLWAGYDDWLSSSVADLNNVSSRPMAGAVTAALFLQRFVAEKVRWAHLDTYAWNDSSRPGRPEGGEALGLRALYDGILRFLNIETDTKQSGNVNGTEPNEMNGL